jgi:cytoskeletal protein CcmA (bactofilin family)
MIISKSAHVVGDIKFNRLLRIEGDTKGKIIAPNDASLVVSRGGSFSGDLVGLGTVYIDGKVHGNVRVARLFLGPHAIVRGDIYCKQMSVAATASIIGQLHVSPKVNITNEQIHRDSHIVEDASPHSSLNTAIEPSPDIDSPSSSEVNLNRQNEHLARETSTVGPEAEIVAPRTRNWLIIFEPQADFFSGGQWSGTSSDEMLSRITLFLATNIEYIDRIVILLDVHYVSHP